MTVKELIEKLSTYPPDTKVLVDGYEGGYDDIAKVGEMMTTKYPHWNQDSVIGAYEEADEYSEYERFNAVVLSR